MEHIRPISEAPDYVRGIPNPVKADLPILQDHLDDVNWEINSIKKQLEKHNTEAKEPHEAMGNHC